MQSSPKTNSQQRIEADLIGAALLRCDYWAEVADLSPDDFTMSHHRAIWSAARSIAARGEIPDAAGIVREVADPDDVGGWAYLAALGDTILPLHSLAPLAAWMREASAKRRLAALGRRLASGGDVGELVADARGELDALVTATNTGPISALVAAERAQALLQERMQVADQIPSLIPSLDRLIAIRSPKLIVLASRPRVGKTALALQITEAACSAGWPVYYVSAEVGADELILRLVARRAGIDVSSFQDRAGLTALPPHVLGRAATAFSDISRWPLMLDDCSRPTMGEIAGRVRAQTTRPALVVVDHLQLVRAEVPSSSGRQSEIEEISRSAKAIAKELGVAVLGLAQLNREVEKRRDGTPRLSDIRDSDALAQDADIALMLHRDEDEDGALTEFGEVFVRKNRQGREGKICVRFDGGRQHFFEEVT